MRILGHRGASAVEPENTIAAFVRAGELGADGVELDVRRSADAALVVHHDARLADGRTLVEVAAAVLPDRVPRLRDALVACGSMYVNIEIKNVAIDPDWDPDESVAEGVAALVEELAMTDRVIVSSFGMGAIDAVRAIDPRIATAWLTITAYDQLRALETAVERGHSALHPHHSVVTEELVTAAHDAGLALNTWTVDDPAQMRRLDALGVDTIVTNDVALAVQTLRGGA
ncbi:MAG TPA: glycerophosphodiester phosphodiesterase [Acidimicrobiales bacterium]|nr:glycerophosphodiester phosphodiesterase [Acidimicrobiales bacterium]